MKITEQMSLLEKLNIYQMRRNTMWHVHRAELTGRTMAME